MKIDNYRCYFLALIIILSLYISIYYPIYPDEITNIFLVGRNGLGNSNKLWLTPACLVSNIYIPAPLLYVYELSQYFYNLINTHRGLRFLSLTLSLASIFVWLKIIYNNGLKKHLLVVLLIFLWPPIFINSFIYLRPEKFLIIFLITSIYIINNKKNIFILIIFFITTVLMVINHPKAFYLLPLYFYTLLIGFKSDDLISKFFKSILVVLTFIISYQTYNIGVQSWICQPIDFIRTFVASYSLNPILLFNNPLDFIYKLFELNNIDRTYRAITQLYIRSKYDIGYMPDIIKVNIISIILFFPFFYLLLKVIYKTVYGIKNVKNNIYFLIYLVSILIIYLFGGNKAGYDIAFIVVAILLIYPFVAPETVNIKKSIFLLLVMIIIYSDIVIGYNIKKGWTGPGVQINHAIDYNSIINLKNKYLNDDYSILYDDNTAFIFNDVHDKYPITYMMNLATSENNLIQKNLSDKKYLFIGRCAYINEITKLDPNLKISNLELVSVRGIGDAVCATSISK